MKTIAPLILASKSPRRKEILSLTGIDCEIVTEEVIEIYPSEIPLDKVPEYLAVLKSLNVANRNPSKIVIGVDTIVLIDNQILGKPKDETEAVRMLEYLSGKTHVVISGVCIHYQGKQILFSEYTNVSFHILPKKWIENYVLTRKPLDKAGSYGIQDFIGVVGVKKIEGCFYNVMGLPAATFIQKLIENHLVLID